MKRSSRIDMKQGLLVDTTGSSTHTPTIARTDNKFDFLETLNGQGSIKVRFTINSLSTSVGSTLLKIIGSSVDSANYLDGWFIGLNKTTKQFIYWNGKYGVVYEFYRTLHDYPTLVEGTYDLIVIKEGTVIRLYVESTLIPITDFANTNGADNIRTVPITLGGLINLEGVPHKSSLTIYSAIILSTIIDKIGGIIKTDYIDAMHTNGNWIPVELHPNVIAHYTLQDTDGGLVMMDCVDQYNYMREGDVLILHSGSTAWFPGSYGANINDWVFSSGVASYSGDGAIGANGTIIIPILTLNNTYKIKFTLVSVTGVWSFQILMNDMGIGGVFNVPGTYEVIGTATANTNLWLWTNCNGVGSIALSNITLENMSNPAIKPVPLELNGYTAGSIPLKDIITKGDVNAILIGNNLITNGNFSANPPNYNWGEWVGGGASFANNRYTTAAIDNTTYLYQLYTPKVNTTYAISFDILSNPSNKVVSATIGYQGYTSGVTEVKRHTLYCTTGSAPEGYFVIRTEGALSNVSISNIEMWEVIPNITKALKLGNVNAGKTLNIPASACTGIGLDNWTMQFQFYMDKDINNSLAGGWASEFLMGNNLWFVIYGGRMHIASDAALVYGFGTDKDWRWEKGFYTFHIQKVASRHILVWINGISKRVEIVGTQTQNAPYPINKAETDLSYNAGIPLYIRPGLEGLHLVSAGVKRGNLTEREMLELHAHTRYTAPKNVDTWEFYTLAEYNGTNFTDLSGHGRHMTQSGYTANQLDPTHPDSVEWSLSELHYPNHLSHVKGIHTWLDANGGTLEFGRPNPEFVTGILDRSGGGHDAIGNINDDSGNAKIGYEVGMRSSILKNDGNYVTYNIGINTDWNILFDGRPHRLYFVNKATTNGYAGGWLATINGGVVSGVYLGINPSDPSVVFYMHRAYDGTTFSDITLNSGTGAIVPGSWNRTEIRFRGKNVSGENDLEMFINNVSKAVYTDVGSYPTTPYDTINPLKLNFDSMENYGLAALIIVDDTGKTSTQIANESMWIDDMLITKYGV